MGKACVRRTQKPQKHPRKQTVHGRKQQANVLVGMHKHGDNVRIQTEERWQLVRLRPTQPVRHMRQDHDEALDPLL